MQDSVIIELYNKRDERAIAETQDKYGAYCMTIAYNILADRLDSEECVNDTYLRAWNTIPPEQPEQLRSYLGAITRHLSLDRYREKTREKRGGGDMPLALEELDEIIAAPSDVEREYDLRALGECINRFLHTRVSARDCDIFLCRYYFVYPVEQIAKQLKFSEAYVRNILSRTRRKLKAYLEKEGYSI
ncbi:MAG: sigma-70 family RNA polymerase sigma factor [Ruminococcaceae bacterium]|nr:sigma-70 family RNA polymerase sigma factor [Oscillospiraceae bacterium]